MTEGRLLKGKKTYLDINLFARIRLSINLWLSVLRLVRHLAAAEKGNNTRNNWMKQASKQEASEEKRRQQTG